MKRCTSKQGNLCVLTLFDSQSLCCVDTFCCPETGFLQSGGVFFFFFAVHIPHSDHTSSAQMRERNNASDMSLVEQRLYAPPFSTSSALHPQLCAVCMTVLFIDSSPSVLFGSNILALDIQGRHRVKIISTSGCCFNSKFFTKAK